MKSIGLNASWMKLWLAILAVSGMYLASCSNETDSDLADITFSKDTLFFDTVFTQMGSDTRIIKIYNKGSKTIQVDKIYLGGGNASVFRFNADGLSGTVVENIVVEPGDSTFIFVEVTLDPNAGNKPLIHFDSLVFESGGATKRVILAAWGQDGVYYYPTDTTSNGTAYSLVGCNTTWAPGKPYVIVGYALVQPGCTLTILPGTKVHFFNNGGLGVLKGGTLQVLGDLDNPVVFEGTRLEFAYRENPGQWNGINIEEGGNGNIIRNAVIKNARIGLTLVTTAAIADPPDFSSLGKITLQNVKILNSSAVGIYSIAYDIKGYNVLSANCGQYCGAFTFGGNVEFYHSTFANYWSGSNRQTPALFLNNFFPVGENLYATTTNYKFRNSLIYGSLENEFDYDTLPGTAIQFAFDYSLLRLDPDLNTSDPLRYNNIVKNTDPKFKNPSFNQYELGSESGAKNAGEMNYVIQNNNFLFFDLRGSNRTIDPDPDAGAYEAN